MNYYKRHLGDFARDCPNLSQGAVGAYTLLLDFYYANEKPLPLDRDELVRIARAFTATDRKALDQALRLFERTDDGYRSKRADEEIAAYQKRAEINRELGKKGGSKPKRKRTESESLSETLSESEANENPSQNPESTNPSDTSARTGSSVEPGDDGVRASTDAGRACRLMREAGCLTTNPHHERLLEALALGITPEALGATAAEAINGGHDVRKAFAYAIGTAIGRRLDPKPTGAAHAAPPRLSASEQVRAAVASRTGYDESDVIECEVRRLA